MSTRRWVVTAIAAAALAAGIRISAEPGDGAGMVPVLRALSKSRHSLADGFRQASKGGETVISGKFEMDHDGKLALSVYTAAKGLSAGAEQNVLKEYIGSPEEEKWAPKVEVFEDVKHVSRASEQLTLMRLASVSLVEVIETAEKEHAGKVFWIAPAIENEKPVIVVRMAIVDGENAGGVNEYAYDAATGKEARESTK